MHIKFQDKLKSSFHHKKFFYRILVPFSILSILLVSSTSILSWNVLGNRYTEKIQESNLQKLRQIQIYTDQHLYNNLFTLINQYLLEGRSSNVLSRFLGGATRLSSSDYYQCYLELNDICLKNNLISCITLYNKNVDVLIDSGYGLSMHPSGAALDLDRIFPFSYYQSILESNTAYYFSPLSETAGLNRNGLVLFRSFPLYTSLERMGYVAITINPDRYISQLEALSTRQEPLLIVDSGGNLLFEKRPSELGLDAEALLTMLEQRATSEIRYEGIQYAITVVDSKETGWKYITYEPLDTLISESVAARQLIFTIAVVTVFIAVLLVNFASNKIYQPIYVLRKKIAQKMESPAVVKNEIAAIEETLVFLESQVDDMKQTIAESKDVLSYKLMMDLLYNHNIDDPELHTRLSLIGLSFHAPCLFLLLIEFDQVLFNNFTYEQREYLAAKAPGCLDEWLGDRYPRLAVSHPPNQIAALINCDEYQYEQWLGQAKELPSYFSSKLHIDVNISISQTMERFSALGMLYKQTSSSLQYAFFLGYGNIFTYELVQEMESTPLPFGMTEFRHLEAMLSTAQYESAAAWLQEKSKAVIRARCSYKVVNEFLIHSFRIAIKASGDTFENPENKERILLSFEQAINFRESLECIIEIIQLHHKNYQQQHKTADVKLISEIKEYIRCHCREELSLSYIADQYSVSSGHLSRLFKSITGENLSVFVVNTKLEQSAAEICENQDINITEIAKEFGYYTPAYFTRLFKQKFGITPSQYRKANSPKKMKL